MPPRPGCRGRRSRARAPRVRGSGRTAAARASMKMPGSFSAGDRAPPRPATPGAAGRRSAGPSVPRRLSERRRAPPRVQSPSAPHRRRPRSAGSLDLRTEPRRSTRRRRSSRAVRPCRSTMSPRRGSSVDRAVLLVLGLARRSRVVLEDLQPDQARLDGDGPDREQAPPRPARGRAPSAATPAGRLSRHRRQTPA